MADETPRRRLKLMNEVLPSPTVSDATSPRARTLSHLQRLMSAAALLAACTKETPSTGSVGYGVVDPMPPPALDRDKPDGGAQATAPDATTGVTPPLAASSATPNPSASSAPQQVVPKPPPIGHGYGVVDPMPTPAPRVPKKGDPNPFGQR